jgi:16S rRNA pseudouridine516 synthase
VLVDGAPVRDPARHVATATAVTLDGAALDHPDGILVALHKPVGVVCSRNDTEGTTVHALLPDAWDRRSPRPEAVGRLDRDTSGLLLVTDDHTLVHRLTSPRHEVAKTYEVTLARPADAALVDALGSGEIVLRGEDRPCRPAVVRQSGARALEITLTEGRYHQVRRMVAACGNHVEALHRTAVGGCRLGDLPAGEWRDVARDELGSAG